MIIPSSLPSNVPLHENQEAITEEAKKESHKKKSERVISDRLLAFGFKEPTHLAGGAQVTSYSLPTVTAENKPNLEQATAFIDSQKFDDAIKQSVEEHPEFVLNFFGRGMALLLLTAEIATQDRVATNKAVASLTLIKQAFNEGLQRQTMQQGIQKLATSVASAVVSTGVGATGAGILTKNSQSARTQMKNDHSLMGKERTQIGAEKARYSEMPESTPTEKTLKSAQAEVIGKRESDLNSLEFKSSLHQNKVDRTQVQGMAVQTAAAAAGGVMDGVGHMIEAENESEIIGTRSAEDITKEIYQKITEWSHQNKETLQQALSALRDAQQTENSMYSALGSNLR